MKVTIEKDEVGPYFLLTENSSKIIVRPEINRRYKIGLKSDLLAKAIGYKKGVVLKVIDATAGLCRDAFHLASLGCQVIALEYNKSIFNVVQHYVNGFSLINIQATDYLPKIKHEDRPEVIYLDPMFQTKKKSAKSSKESELLKALSPVPTEKEENALLEVALGSATKRVVVKRALHSKELGAGIRKPQLQINGKAVRYDVYFIY